MAQALTIDGVEGAIDLLRRAARDEIEFEISSLKFAHWDDLIIHLPHRYESEIPSPYIDYYDRTQDEIYKFAALVENGSADIRTLTIDQLNKYQLRVKVSPGSSVFGDNAKELIAALATKAFEKMDGKQIVIALLGLAVIGATTWGALNYIEANKETRLEEIRAEERSKIISDLTAVSKEQTEAFREILEIMRDSGELPKRAEKTAEELHSSRLRAASQVDETVIGDVHITGEQAREIRSSKRRKSMTRYITQEMKVVDVNTADPQHTTIILEDPISGDQHRVTYRDAMIQAEKQEFVFDALKNRDFANFRLKIKAIEGDVVSIEIVDVLPLAPEERAQIEE